MEWAILTNGLTWKLYKVLFEKPINHEEIFEISILDSSHRDRSLIEKLYVLSKEALSKSAIERFSEKSQMTNKYTIAAILQTMPIANLVRRQIRQMAENIRIDPADILSTIQEEILKRDVLDSEITKQAMSKIKRNLKNAHSKSRAKSPADEELNGNCDSLESGEVKSPAKVS